MKRGDCVSGLDMFGVAILTLLFLGCQSGYEVNETIAGELPARIDFNFHIKPILSDRCYSCHGPDKNALKAELRLDTEEGLKSQLLSSGQRAFVSGNISKSEAFQRMISDDPEMQMPPPEFQRQLTSYDISLMAKWIEQGAKYKPHWAFILPEKTPLPDVEGQNWCSNEIDYFILEKLLDRKLVPNTKASKEILLRRATLDVTGLPPSIKEIDEFLADESTDAFDKVVDRLLASPHFGERMATKWLDLARYADSNGYSQDGLRIMWPWRDWVIEAFNKNLPYDQFMAWQIAGDKLPNATQEQILATAFLRNHRQNAEGGIVDEEYRIEYAADRTETASTVFLGMTMQCARCHDHKYDPISQEEYYQFFSFFNNINERGITASDDNSGPEVVLTSAEVQERLDFIDQQIRDQQKLATGLASTITSEDLGDLRIDLKKDLLVDLSFDEISAEHLKNKVDPTDQFKLSGEIDLVEGYRGKAIKFTAFDWINVNKKAIKFDRGDPFSFAFYLRYEQDNNYVSILNHLGSKALNFPGYEVAILDGYPSIRMVHSFPATSLEVRTSHQIAKGEWVHLTFTYDGSGTGEGIQLFVNGQEDVGVILQDNLSQGIANGKGSLTVGGRIPYNDENDGYGFIDELKIFCRQLSDIEALALFREKIEIEDVPEDLQKRHLLLTQNREYRHIANRVQALRKERFAIEDTLVSVMVMQDLAEPRATYLLNRGAYDAPGKQVFASAPASIYAYSNEAPRDRSGLAGWLLDDSNPLTARVAVNRFWQLLFGQGIVKTAEDFGSQGALPSHPELLDWLAVHFRDSGWNMKAMFKFIMLSSTYQQSSTVTAGQRSQNPTNVWLSRGPSMRLSAEQIRDCALASSGLLVRQIGGPSVKPYQPPGLWEEKGEFSLLKNYQQDTGANLYRRSLYTFWRRTSPPPSMTTFDSPTRDICIASRQETNTPLQALVLLNDPQFVEAARVLAEQVIREERADDQQIIRAHRLLTGRFPKPEIIKLLRELKIKEKGKFDLEPELAKQMLEVGEYPADRNLDTSEVSAMAIVCSTIMSFDETLVKR